MMWIILFILFSSCQDSEFFFNAPAGRQKAEYINRTEDQLTFIPPPVIQPAPQYFWEKNQNNKGIREITKEYFRCNGNDLNPIKSDIVRGEVMKYHDCGGSSRHSLPLKEEKEWIYPVLVDLLNQIQIKMNRRVIITSGHRCPAHNTYVDPAPQNQYSKHQIGAEVDFYVQGYEDHPEDVLEIIFNYYLEHPLLKTKKEYNEFKRYDKEVNVTTKPWMNKEIFIKLHKAKEGRNDDNRHPYPYLTLQVRHDRDKNEKVAYSWEQAFGNYLRY